MDLNLFNFQTLFIKDTSKTLNKIHINESDKEFMTIT